MDSATCRQGAQLAHQSPTVISLGHPSFMSVQWGDGSTCLRVRWIHCGWVEATRRLPVVRVYTEQSLREGVGSELSR